MTEDHGQDMGEISPREYREGMLAVNSVSNVSSAKLTNTTKLTTNNTHTYSLEEFADLFPDRTELDEIEFCLYPENSSLTALEIAKQLRGEPAAKHWVKRFYVLKDRLDKDGRTLQQRKKNGILTFSLSESRREELAQRIAASRARSEREAMAQKSHAAEQERQQIEKQRRIEELRAWAAEQERRVG